VSEQTPLFPESPRGAAHFSECGRYRYWLTRQTGRPGGEVVFLMLNPSTADASEDDPTIRRCIGFAQREGFGSLLVLNLFALRATDPAELARANDPVGPHNDAVLAAHFAQDFPIVCAWGAHDLARTRWRDVRGACWDRVRPLLCLGTTRDGSPKHPLYLRADTPLQRFL